MRSGHQPGAEKRSLVIVPRESQGDWLGCRDPEVARLMLNLYPAELMKARPVAKGYDGKPQQEVFL